MISEPVIDPSSVRALAYEIQSQLNGGKVVITSSPEIYEIEAEIRHQYGLLLEKEDQQRLAAGQKPDPVRLKTTNVILSDDTCNDCDRLTRTAVVSDYMAWNGRPYIIAVGSCAIKFSPVDSRFMLANRVRRTRQPAYAVEGNMLYVRLTPDTASVDAIEVTGILKDPFNGVVRNHDSMWRLPWIATESMKAVVKERVEVRFKGGTVATWQRQDKINNGLENPVKTQ